MRLGRIGRIDHRQFGAGDGLDAGRQRRLVEAHQAEQVGVIGDGNRRHAAATAALTKGLMRTRPSTSEYSVCRCRWTKPGSGGFHEMIGSVGSDLFANASRFGNVFHMALS
jgi:hypothetical protein